MVRCVALLLLTLIAATGSRATGRPEARLYLVRQPTTAEAARLNTHAKYEPAVGCYLGAYIDFDATLTERVRDETGTAHASPTAFEAVAGKLHAMYFFYMGYGKRLPLDWVRELARQGKMVHIALEPNRGLGEVRDDAYLRRLADELKQSGARVFLRFASEMNGKWTRYHGNPGLYRAKFRLVHDVMRKRAPNVAMVWCPYATPRWNITEYYPGDDATDWVGVNMYS
ncbi:MAG TPA: glycosyl hydrolase, partial [Chthonomonadaceae bacterium]|nr:glycosyl hydrolase [Chthonomonadaceae bacterium]